MATGEGERGGTPGRTLSESELKAKWVCDMVHGGELRGRDALLRTWGKGVPKWRIWRGALVLLAIIFSLCYTVFIFAKGIACLAE